MRWIAALSFLTLAACNAPEGQRVPDGGLGGTGKGPDEICTNHPDCPEELAQNAQDPVMLVG